MRRIHLLLIAVLIAVPLGGQPQEAKPVQPERQREQGKPEIRVLISTDVLSEGLNLQDASRMMNYDIHWNPVRLMQRIGRAFSPTCVQFGMTMSDNRDSHDSRSPASEEIVSDQRSLKRMQFNNVIARRACSSPTWRTDWRSR